MSELQSYRKRINRFGSNPIDFRATSAARKVLLLDQLFRAVFQCSAWNVTWPRSCRLDLGSPLTVECNSLDHMWDSLNRSLLSRRSSIHSCFIVFVVNKLLFRHVGIRLKRKENSIPSWRDGESWGVPSSTRAQFWTLCYSVQLWKWIMCLMNAHLIPDNSRARPVTLFAQSRCVVPAAVLLFFFVFRCRMRAIAEPWSRMTLLQQYGHYVTVLVLVKSALSSRMCTDVVVAKGLATLRPSCGARNEPYMFII